MITLNVFLRVSKVKYWFIKTKYKTITLGICNISPSKLFKDMEIILTTGDVSSLWLKRKIMIF